MEISDSIIALATPRGRSALAILRLSGPLVFSVFRRVIDEKNKFDSTIGTDLRLYNVLNSGIFIDEITAVKYKYPHSFTGEDMIEIICHGSPVIVDQIISLFNGNGIRNAQKGEFTKRAFLNGKMSLLKAESIHGIIESNSELEIQSSRNNYKGIYKEIIGKWKEQIIDILVEIESSIEFNEENDIQNQSKSDYKSAIINIQKAVLEEITKRDKIELYQDGIRIVIVGPVNAGKSSLFNTIVGDNRSIVHHIPGTTRDYITETIKINKYINGLLIDSAGLRDSENEIEIIGINRVKSLIFDAHIVLWVSSSNEVLTHFERDVIDQSNGKEIVCILNKVDICASNTEKELLCLEKSIKVIKVSLKDSVNIDGIFKTIEEKSDRIVEKIEIPSIIQNKRQKDIIAHIYSNLSEINFQSQQEITAYHLNQALKGIEELEGKIDSDEVINRIFEQFCIGK